MGRYLDIAHAIRDKPVSGAVALNDAGVPLGSCPDCGAGQWWQLPRRPWHCRACAPDMPFTATTLTLPCHTEQVPPVGPHAGLDRMIENACEGLAITPEQLRQALEDTDLPALASGERTLKALRLTAWTLALAHHGLPDRRAEKQRRAVLRLLAQAAAIDRAMISIDDAKPDGALVTLRSKARQGVNCACRKLVMTGCLVGITQ